MSIILGIDPGSRKTGYGVIRDEGAKQIYLDCGCIETQADSLDQRLQQIFTGIREIALQYSPDSAGIEQVFMHKNATAALIIVAPCVELVLLWQHHNLLQIA